MYTDIIVYLIILFFVSFGIFFLIFCLFPKRKKREDLPIQNKSSDSDDSEQEKIIKDCFTRTYFDCLDELKKCSCATNAEFELLPALFSICLMVSILSPKLVSYSLMKQSFHIFPDMNPTKFSSRCKLYWKTINGFQLRNEWFAPLPEDLSDVPPISVLIMLGDILIDPACAEDYENAPRPVFGSFDIFDFNSAMYSVIDKVVAMCKKIQTVS